MRFAAPMSRAATAAVRTRAVAPKMAPASGLGAFTQSPWGTKLARHLHYTVQPTLSERANRYAARHAAAKRQQATVAVRDAAAPLLPPPEDPTKKCLVLDLDETLVHSTYDAVAAGTGVSVFTVSEVIERGSDHSTFDVNVIRRPGLDEFLGAVGSRYEVIVFTAALPNYANAVIDIIDPSGVIKHRLFREHCVLQEGEYVKDLSKLGRDLKSTMIIDNLAASYQLQPANGIACSSFIDDPNDRTLYELLPLLESLRRVADVTHALAKL